MTWEELQEEMEKLLRLAGGLWLDRRAAFESPGVLTGSEMHAYAEALKGAHRSLMEARAALHAAQRRRGQAQPPNS
jgi:hypothetical protein